MLNHTDFDAWAGHYDESIPQQEQGYPFAGYYDVLAFIREQLHPLRDKSILDIGIGTGLLSTALYEQGARIWGLDFSYQMLQLAKEKMPGGNFTLGDFCQGVPAEMQHLKFDNIVSSYAVHHIQEHEQPFVLGQFLDLLRPEGTLVVGDIGFKTWADREYAKTKFASSWDYTECYLVGDIILRRLQQVGARGKYTQVSPCAGVLTIRKT